MAGIIDIVSYINNLISNIQKNIADNVVNANKHADSQVTILNNALSTYINNNAKNAQEQINYLNSSLNSRLASAQVDANSKIASLGGTINAAIYNTNKQVSDLSLAVSNQIKGLTDVAFKNAQQQTDTLGKIVKDLQLAADARLNNVLKEIQEKKSAERLNQEAHIISRTSDILLGDNTLPPLLAQGLSDTFSFITPEITNGVNDAIEQIKRLVKDLEDGKYDSFDDFMRDFDNIFKGSGFIVALLSIIGLVPFLVNIANDIYHPVLVKLGLLTNEKFRPTVLGIAEELKFYATGFSNWSTAKEKLALLGVSSSDSELLLENAHTQLDFNTLKLLYNRKFISEKHATTILKKLGFSDGDIEILFEAFKYIPSIQDLIVFAVREVFSPQQAQELGLYLDFPEQFKNEAAKLGMDENTAKKYWAAHWQLPSPQMGFEMFHRRIISRDSLQNLLKALDYSPAWRDNLIKLSYSPLTRVDVRRMYGLGVLNAQQVYESYLDIGYSPENAARLRDFTIRYESADDNSDLSELRRLTQATIVKAYVRGALTRQQAFSRLLDIKYVADDANLILNLADYDKEVDKTPDRSNDINTKITGFVIKGYTNGLIPYDESLDLLVEFGYLKTDAIQELSIADLTRTTQVKENVIKEAIAGYIENTYSDVEFRTILDAFGFSSQEISNQLNLALPYKAIRTKKPTYTQFIKMAEKGIISVDELSNELAGLGFADKYIPMLLLLEDLVEA